MKLLDKIKSGFAFTHTGISCKQKWRISLPGPIINIGGVLIHNVFIKFYTDIIGFDPKYVGWVYIIYNIWNAVNDPIIGLLIDKMKYNQKHGKYVYLLRVTVPLMMISSFAMILSSPTWSQWLIFLVYTAELFVYDTAATAYSVAYGSYILIAAPTKEERVDVNVIQNYISQAMSFVITLIPTLLLVGDGKRSIIIPIFSAVILVETVFFMLALKGLPDTEQMYATLKGQHIDMKDLRKTCFSIIKSRPFLTTILFSILIGPVRVYFTPFLYFMDDVLRVQGTTATIIDLGSHLIALAFLPFMARVFKKIGIKKSVYWAVIPATIGFGGIFFANSVITTFISYVFIVFTVNYIGTVTSPMGSLMIDEDERVSGIRKTGLYSGLMSIFTVAFGGLQTAVFTGTISAFGYVGTAAVQTDSAVLGIRIATGLIPLAAILLSIIPMIFFPFDHKKEEEISAFSNSARRGDESI